MNTEFREEKLKTLLNVRNILSESLISLEAGPLDEKITDVYWRIKDIQYIIDNYLNK